MAAGLFRSRQRECEASFPYHAYIDTCASYSSTPYPELLSNLKKQARGLIGHSNAGLCGMDLSGSLGALKQVWLVAQRGRSGDDHHTEAAREALPRGIRFHPQWGRVYLSHQRRQRACPNLTSGSSRPKQFCLLNPKRLCPLCRRCKGTCKDLPSVKSKKCERLVRRKQCWGIPPTVTFWEWYLAA